MKLRNHSGCLLTQFSFLQLLNTRKCFCSLLTRQKIILIFQDMLKYLKLPNSFLFYLLGNIYCTGYCELMTEYFQLNEGKQSTQDNKIMKLVFSDFRNF